MPGSVQKQLLTFCRLPCLLFLSHESTWSRLCQHSLSFCLSTSSLPVEWKRSSHLNQLRQSAACRYKFSWFDCLLFVDWSSLSMILYKVPEYECEYQQFWAVCCGEKTEKWWHSLQAETGPNYCKRYLSKSTNQTVQLKAFHLSFFNFDHDMEGGFPSLVTWPGNQNIQDLFRTKWQPSGRAATEKLNSFLQHFTKRVIKGVECFF